MADKSKGKKKNKDDNGKKVFIITASIVSLLIAVPILLLIISSIINYDAAKELDKSIYPLKYESYVEEYAQEFDVDKCLVYGIIKTESGFNPDAVSPVGAIGLMQLMPDTFTWLQNYRTQFQPEKLLGSDELFDPKLNIEYGVYLLSYLMDMYDGNIPLVICSYNAGHGNIDEWLSNGTINGDNVIADNIPFPETANYLTRVQTAMDAYRELYFPDYVYTYIGEEQTESQKDLSQEQSQEVWNNYYSEPYADGETYNDNSDDYDYNDYNYDDYNYGGYYYNEDVGEEYYY